MRELFYGMECHGISGLLGTKGPIKRLKEGVGLFIALQPMRVHATMHRDVCSLLSLK